jgi:hypothetical protein
MLLRQIGGDAWIELKGEPNAMGYVSFVTVLHIPLKNLSLNQAVA